jgi:uncharacterized protein
VGDIETRDLRRTLLWRRLDESGSEYFSLSSDGRGWRLEGTCIVALEGSPFHVRYAVGCDQAWNTREVHVHLWGGPAESELRIAVDDRQRWWAAGEELASVRGCLDVDLGVTPSTNTLPIRRLEMPMDGVRDVTAAWIKFPDLEVSPLRQTYTRLGKQRYLYESRDSDFITLLDVDELGLVSRYAGNWQRDAEI